MTIHLSRDVESSILAAVQSGRFPSVDDAVAAAWKAFNQEQTPPPLASDEAVVPAWQRLLDNMKQVPDEVFDRIPVDSSAQLDHYLYNSPKRPTE
jgi:Arc/MetJ-type ribon-helix-helix transcriptional regulator